MTRTYTRFKNKYDGDVFPLLAEAILTQHKADISEYAFMKWKVQDLIDTDLTNELPVKEKLELRKELVYQTNYLRDLRKKIEHDHEFLLKTPCKGALEASVEAALNAAYEDQLQWLAEFIADMCSSS